MFRGLGVGLDSDDYPWEEEGVDEAFEEASQTFLVDERWLALKKDLGLRKVEVWLEHSLPTDERERVEIYRRKATVKAIAYRDIARMEASGDSAAIVRQEVGDAFEAVRQALLADRD